MTRHAYRKMATLLVGATVVMASCSTAHEPRSPTPFLPDVPPVPELKTDLFGTGQSVYSVHCAECHGEDLAGAPDWMDRNSDGTWRPPPMDSTGHAWHHSDTTLRDIIENGSNDPQSAMVGWDDQLTNAQIDAVIEFIKSTWGHDERAFQWTVTRQEEQRKAGP